MIERERQRANTKTLQASLPMVLCDRQASVVDRVVRTAFERGYARHLPDLTATLQVMVAGICEAFSRFGASRAQAPFLPGEELVADPIFEPLRNQVSVLRASGVRAEVFCGLLRLCRETLSADLSGIGLENESQLREQIDLCLERLELGAVAIWTSRDCGPTEPRAGVGTIDGAVAPGIATDTELRDDSHGGTRSGDVASVVVEANQEANHRGAPRLGEAERINELLAANQSLRSELERRLRVDAERSSHFDALLQSQKLEAVGSLAGGVAHELNNLFQVLRCNNELLRARADSASCGMLEEIHQAAERSVALVRQLLMFSRRQPMARHVLDVGEVVRDLSRLLRRFMPESIRLVVEVEPQLPQVRADLSAIQQLIVNLVINARDAMPEGGTIHVDVRSQQRVPPERVRASSSMQQIGIFVRDAGIGMSEEVRGRIFDPFFTTKNRSAGLGLSVVHGVIEEHGGWVEVSSTVGMGSCFAVYLPVMVDAALSGIFACVDDDAIFRGQGERLLLVEDEEIVRRALARELARLGYVIQAVGNADEALAIYRRAPWYFDCVISDGMMPGMTGPEMLLEMLKVNEHQRAIFISSYAPTIDCWSELQNRGFRLLAKPFNTRELLVALRETLQDAAEAAAMTVRSPHLAGCGD